MCDGGGGDCVVCLKEVGWFLGVVVVNGGGYDLVGCRVGPGVWGGLCVLVCFSEGACVLRGFREGARVLRRFSEGACVLRGFREGARGLRRFREGAGVLRGFREGRGFCGVLGKGGLL